MASHYQVLQGTTSPAIRYVCHVETNALVIFPEIFRHQPIPVQEEDVPDTPFTSGKVIKLLWVMSPKETGFVRQGSGCLGFMPRFRCSEYEMIKGQSFIPIYYLVEFYKCLPLIFRLYAVLPASTVITVPVIILASSDIR